MKIETKISIAGAGLSPEVSVSEDRTVREAGVG